MQKAKRATASLIANKVDDDGVVNKDGKGTRNQQILENAQFMEKDKEQSKKSKKK